MLARDDARLDGRRMGAAIRIVALVLGIACSVSAAHAQPSFDCRKASTATEKAICADPRLARLDRAIAVAFRQLKAELQADDTLPNEQEEFLKQRDQCAADAACLMRALDNRRGALTLQPQPGRADRREGFVGRYSNRFGWAIVRRALDGRYQFTASAAEPSGRWVCDVSGSLGEVNRTSVSVVEAGDEDDLSDSHPVYLKMRGGNLTIAEDSDRRLAGYLCGANGSIEGTYRRVQKLR